METLTVMRRLRIKYGVTIRELARAAGVSHQYISKLELGSRHDIAVVQRAFERVIEERKMLARVFELDYYSNSERLLSEDIT